jgi:hypothetical protein
LSVPVVPSWLERYTTDPLVPLCCRCFRTLLVPPCRNIQTNTQVLPIHNEWTYHPASRHDAISNRCASILFLNLLKLLLYEIEGREGALLSNDNRSRLLHRVGSAFDILVTYSTARFSTGKKAQHCCRRRYSNPPGFVIPCVVSCSVTTLMFCLSAVYLLLVGAKIYYSSENLLIVINLFVLLSGL